MFSYRQVPKRNVSIGFLRSTYKSKSAVIRLQRVAALEGLW